MNAQQIIDIETKHSAGTYAKQPLVIVRGEGALLFDADGVEYLESNSRENVHRRRLKGGPTVAT